jgi:deazaflavin-dependent oxidoreductase (nitroreductase family)
MLRRSTGAASPLDPVGSRASSVPTARAWGAAEPAWWLNLQADPDATAKTRDGTRSVRARRAQGAERDRLWSRWAEIDTNLDAYAARRPTETAVVVLEPRVATMMATR